MKVQEDKMLIFINCIIINILKNEQTHSILCVPIYCYHQ